MQTVLFKKKKKHKKMTQKKVKLESLQSTLQSLQNIYQTKAKRGYKYVIAFSSAD